MRFKYFVEQTVQSRLIESGQFTDTFYVFSVINLAQDRMIESSSFIVIFLDSLHWPAGNSFVYLTIAWVGSRINNPSLRLLIGALTLEIDIVGVLWFNAIWWSVLIDARIKYGGCALCERNIVYNQTLAAKMHQSFHVTNLSRASSRCTQCCWRTNKRPTCIPDFEKHPPLFIATSYTPELPFPSKSVSFALKNENLSARPASRKLILKSLISGQRVTFISHSPPPDIHESLSRSASGHRYIFARIAAISF